MSVSHIKLKDKYSKEVVPKLREKFSIKNSLAVPKITKVVVNAGLGKKLLSVEQGKTRTALAEEFKGYLKLITGQAPAEAKAKKSIAGFKSRDGMVIGLKTTLRGDRMYEFLDRLISYALPRVRDFRGLSLKNLDKDGNLNIGLADAMAFPELPPASSKNIFGLQITVVISSKDKEQSKELLYLMGFPLQKDKK